MDGITDVLYLNKTEKVNVTTYEKSILIKNENIDINIAYNEIFNYTIEKEYISLYMYRRYYKKVKKIINNKNEYTNDYIIVKLYYDDSTNKIVKHFDKLIKDNYKKEVSEGYIFAIDEEDGEEYDCLCDLKCGFEEKKNSKVDVSTDWKGFSITLCEKDYFNRLKKSYYVQDIISCDFKNVVSVELKGNCLTILVYLNEEYSSKSRFEAQFFAVATDEKDYFKMELYGDKKSLEVLKSRLESRITFTTPENYKQKIKELEAEKGEKYRKEEEERQKVLKRMVPNIDRAYELNCAILGRFGLILVILGIATGLDFVMLIGFFMWLLPLILLFKW